MLTIVDYGVGNLASIQNMLKRIGVSSIISSREVVISDADQLILPGVGAFDTCVEKLNASGLMEILNKKVLADKTPILGVCVGLVPVVSKIPGGITDIVTPDIGFVIDVDNNEAFAHAIARLYADRLLLNRLGMHAREKVITGFDVKQAAAGYHDLFLRYREFYREKQLLKLKVGARLDHPFVPRAFTKFVRTLREKKWKLGLW